MSIFALGNDVQQEVEKDSLGGGLFESGTYDFTVEMAYLSKSKGGAMGINLTFKTEDGRTLRENGWISSGDAKGNSFTYEKDGKKYPLPDYAKLDNLCKLAIGKSLGELEPEKKTIKVWDHEQKKEVPKEVPVLMDLLKAKITAGVLKATVDKTSKNDATGKYEPNGETRDINEIDKYFRTEDKLTSAEIQAEATEPEFYEAWQEKNKGKLVNRAKGASGNTGTAGAPTGGTDTSSNTKSLFG